MLQQLALILLFLKNMSFGNVSSSLIIWKQRPCSVVIEHSVRDTERIKFIIIDENSDDVT